MRSKLKPALCVLALAMVAGGCDKKEKTDDSNFISFPVKIEVKTKKQLKSLPNEFQTPSKSQNKILKQINTNKKVNYEDLKSALTLYQARNYAFETGKSLPTAQKKFHLKIDQHTKDIPSSKKASELKPLYEKSIENDLKEAISYDPDKYASQFMTEDAKMQCSSGTQFFQIAARNVYDLNQFDKQSMVIINSPGHVLPGFIESSKEGPVLTGIETTAAGKALVQYGYVNKFDGCLQIVDPHVDAVANVLGDYIANPDALSNYNNKLMQDKYKIDVKRLRENCEKQISALVAAMGADGLGRSNKTKKGTWGSFANLPGPQIDVKPGPRYQLESKVANGALIPGAKSHFYEYNYSNYEVENFQLLEELNKFNSRVETANFESIQMINIIKSSIHNKKFDGMFLTSAQETIERTRELIDRANDLTLQFQDTSMTNPLVPDIWNNIEKMSADQSDIDLAHTKYIDLDDDTSLVFSEIAFNLEQLQEYRDTLIEYEIMLQEYIFELEMNLDNEDKIKMETNSPNIDNKTTDNNTSSVSKPDSEALTN